MVANGDKLSCSGYCKKVRLSLHGFTIFTDFYLLALEGRDVVLGAYWLRTLGPIIWDFSNLWMRFTLNGKDYQLKGMAVGSPSILNPSELKKNLERERDDALVMLHSRNSTDHESGPADREHSSSILGSL